ncbi:hypothetical protein BJ875DRAFT_365839 [Amylocarpus encephaloides]|uniref:TauD/TfdA-like domain-containing protein n=1 Tax=Amylocarpus encephaloides TaxID=45428 RepID=A0A9P7YT91_9HELO|nr:hypothetical protein BJ875DRAFT_365839 [Amylocarpus encephaloides]
MKKPSAREHDLLRGSNLQRGTIPPTFPNSIVSPTAWSGADLELDLDQQQYCLLLDELQIAELEQASRNFKELGYSLEEMSQQTFSLPKLGKRLKALAVELTEGAGFFRIRGLDPRRYSREMNVILYVGLSSYIGGKRGRQDELGNMLLHLTDVGSAVDPDNQRQSPYSNVEQPFHTDTGDIIGLYSLGGAQCGGESRLASTAAVYNEIVKTRPDMISLLSSPSWIFDRFGQWPPWKMRPLLYPIQNQNALLSFSRRPLVGNASSPRSADIPDLPPSHVEAMNAVHFAADHHALSIKLQAGDILFWNNLALMHGRRGFTDSAEEKRHLIRLWLRNEATENAWPIPEDLKTQWNDAFEHVGRPQLWPLEPIRDQGYISTQQRSSGHA